LGSTTAIECANIQDIIGDLANLSLFELENIRCTAEQHRIVNFLIELRKISTGTLPTRDNNAVQQIEKFYTECLTLNSPIDKEMVL
jgi:hypothetical protein